MAFPLILGIAAVAGLVKNQVDKSKESNSLIEAEEAKCAEEARNYKKTREETKFQSNMLKLLLTNSFNEFEQDATPPLSDWKHFDDNIKLYATKQHSLFTWGNYSFYTRNAIYYHNKSKAIHELLYFDKINEYNINTGIVDYGIEHEKRNISQWESFDKKFVEQISNLWKSDNEYDTSFLEFCYNNCHDFKMNLAFYKTDIIRETFKKTCKENNFPKTLLDNFNYIEIKSMNEGKIELEFWNYFRKDEDFEEAEEHQYDAELTFSKLQEMKKDISKLFNQALRKLYGVTFKIENIYFTDSPNFSYESPTVIDRINNTAKTAQAFIDDYANKHDLKP